MKKNGTWGTCQWELYAWGHLAISGGRAESTFSPYDAPWHECKDEITSVSVDEPVTFEIDGSIAHLFEGCSNLKRANLSKMNTVGVVDMSSLFEDCTNLTEIDLSGFDTLNTTNMRSMFMNCESLEQINLSNFDTCNVTDMSWMFSGCEKIKKVDITGWDTSSVRNMSHMFQYCSSLQNISTENFDMASVQNVEDMFDGTDGYGEYIEEALAQIIEERDAREEALAKEQQEAYEAEEASEDEPEGEAEEEPTEHKSFWSRFGRRAREDAEEKAHALDEDDDDEAEDDEEEDSASEEFEVADGGITTVTDVEVETTEATEATEDAATLGADEDADLAEGLDVIPDELSTEEDKADDFGQRMSWNEDDTSSNLVSLDGERNIYAGAPFFVGPVEQIPPITYGQRLELRAPQIDRNNGDSVTLTVEISPDGVNRWTQFDPNAILPVSGNGCYVRYKVSNWIGASVSDPIRITIRKADYDLRHIRWKGLDNTTYDGNLKSVKMVGLPEGLRAEYSGNQATDAGEYVASAVWVYDDRNFNTPPAPEDFLWKITKADYYMSDAKWAYTTPYDYNGERQEIVLEGIPSGITVDYRDNSAIESGIYYASCELRYDEVNYNAPRMITPCTWEIRKAHVDMSNVQWDFDNSFKYDGSIKKVALLGVPEGVIAHYSGNRGVDSGTYTAVASFEVLDTRNYYVPDKISTRWEIETITVNMSAVDWDYSVAYKYNGNVQSVLLRNLPEEVAVRYIGNSAIETGTYTARAEFSLVDDVNYVLSIESMSLEWAIEKASYTLTDTEWSYVEPFTYDGSTKCVELVNLPNGVTAEYEGNTATDAGVYSAKAVLRYDEKNYHRPSDLNLSWEIKKADVDLSGTFWMTKNKCVYDGNEKVVELAGIPEQINVEYEGNVAIEVGEYYASASATLKDENNYNIPRIKGVNWKITTATVDMSKVEWNYKDAFTYDGDTKKISLINIPADFEVEYSGNEATEAGEYIAQARFIPLTSNYEVPEDMSCHWTISKADYDLGMMQWKYDSAIVYDGTVKTLELRNIPNGLTAQYSGNAGVDVGRYSASVTLINADPDNYNTPTFDGISWLIEKATYDMKSVKWTTQDDMKYDGTIKTVELTGLPSGVSAVYADNQKTYVGSYIATADLIYDENNYYRPSVDDYEWKIVKGIYDTESIKWEYGTPFTYDGQVKEVELVGCRSDLSVRYSMNKAVDAGKYVATAYFTLESDNYECPEPMTLDWEIEKATFDMGNVQWSYERPYTYSGTAHTVALYNLPEGVWADYEQNVAVDAGTYEAVATFGINNQQNYVVPDQMNCLWRIEKADLDMTRAHWNYEKPIVCNGKEQRIELTGLPQGITAIYQGNTATYSGTYEASCEFALEDDWNFNVPKLRNIKWEVVKDTLDMSQVQWTYTKALTYNGYEQSVVLEGLPQGVSATYFGNTATEAGTYEARVRLVPDDEERYQAPSFENCRWRIRKADIDMSEVVWSYDEGMFTYDGQVKTITLKNLPDICSASYVGNTESSAGNYIAAAYITVDDSSNYNTPVIPDCRWRIDKARYDMSQVFWNNDDVAIYDGNLKTVELSGLPAGVTAKYFGNAAVNAGVYTATANLIVDYENYEIPTVSECKWVIERADANISNVTWDYSESFTFDGKRKQVQLIGIPQGMSVTYRNNSQIAAGTYTAEAFISMDDKLNFNAPDIEPLTWTIEKATFDMSHVEWNNDGNYIYDGNEKSVYLKGLPDGVAAGYMDNRAIAAGTYEANAILTYDEANYNRISIAPYEWTIDKADYNLKAVAWDYTEEFKYDGTGKRIKLIGLPDSIKPVYNGNYAVDAGEYEATVSFIYDNNNYNEPEVAPFTWKIGKAEVDLGMVKWDYYRPYQYDGTPQHVQLLSNQAQAGLFDKLLGTGDESLTIVGLPQGMRVRYEDNVAVDAGTYVAKAYIIPDNLDNYEEPEPIECTWEIKKTVPDMSQVKWDYRNDCIYDGTEKKVQLANIPNGVNVAAYYGNTAVDVGTYIARAVFKVDPSSNYLQPEELTLRWKIEKRNLDMSSVYWSYDEPFEYDGEPKMVTLENLPKEVSVSYINNVATEPGTYVTRAILSFDQASYRMAEIPDCKWKIEG